MRVIGFSRGFRKSVVIRLGDILPTPPTAMRLPGSTVDPLHGRLYGVLNLLSAYGHNILAATADKVLAAAHEHCSQGSAK